MAKPQPPNIFWAYISAWADPLYLSSHESWQDFFMPRLYHVRRWFISFSSTISGNNRFASTITAPISASLPSSPIIGLMTFLRFPSLQFPRWRFKCENPHKKLSMVQLRHIGIYDLACRYTYIKLCIKGTRICCTFEHIICSRLLGLHI